MNFLCFYSVGNVIIPTDVHSIILQRGGKKTPTSLDKLPGESPKLSQAALCCLISVCHAKDVT